MTFYTPLERLAKSAKEQGMAVKADAETVLRLCEIARAAEAMVRLAQLAPLADRERLGMLTDEAYQTLEQLEAAFFARAALGTQPAKEMK